MSDSFIHSLDGTRLRLVVWEPEGAPKAQILLSHGFAEHMGRYDHVGRFFAAQGYRVTGVEFRGHGDSEGRRGFVNQWERYSEDLGQASRSCSAPLFLVAHSMGGLVVLDALRAGWTGPAIRGVVLSNPMLGLSIKAPAWKTFAAKFLSVVLPALPMGNEIDTAKLSRDASVGEAYGKDPRVFRTVTPRWYTESLIAMTRVKEHAPRFGMPLLGLVSTADGLCSHEDFVAFLANYGKLATTRIFEGHFHELFNEPDKAEVLASCAEWMNALL